MKPAIRTQIDDLAEEYSQATAIDCSNLPDKTRQEFKDETDVNQILARFGVNTPMRQPIYGAVDYDMDLQQSLAAIKTAQQTADNLPKQLRDKYYHWEMLLEGMRSGQFKTDLDAYLADQKASKAAQTATGTQNALSKNEPKQE